jgi:uncharacterized phage-associated protein
MSTKEGEDTMRERKDFCTECRRETSYTLKKIKINQTIREKKYTFEITAAFCNECGGEMGIPGLMDYNMKEIDEQYRKAEEVITVEDIERLMKLYNIGKAPLSLALGFGEVTITRYLAGQVPSKEYSDIMLHALASASYMKELLDQNREKIGETAYKKAYTAATQLENLYVAVPVELLAVIAYIFSALHEVTPLTLQKLLYYIQGNYAAIYDKPLFDAPCEAWVHGPVYRNVYNLFRDFKYNPIDDDRFVPLKESALPLTPEAKEVVDRVLDTLGMYSGKVLESITHKEAPWLDARKGFLPDETSHAEISLDAMKAYFKNVDEKYNIRTEDGLREYIATMI